MGNEYQQYPSSVKDLAKEIKRACDDYNARRITNDQIREIIFWYATHQADRLFAAENLNPTVRLIIGKRREKLVNDLLDGFQSRLL